MTQKLDLYLTKQCMWDVKIFNSMHKNKWHILYTLCIIIIHIEY